MSCHAMQMHNINAMTCHGINMLHMHHVKIRWKTCHVNNERSFNELAIMLWLDVQAKFEGRLRECAAHQKDVMKC